MKPFFRPERFSRGDTNVLRIQPIDEAAWIWPQDIPDRDDQAGVFVRFRRDFEGRPGEPLRIDVSADERFVLLLDGKPFAEGPHRGLENRWTYLSYEGTLSAGPHRLEATVWRLTDKAPLAQISIRGGFILHADGGYDADLTTGKAAWTAARLTGTRATTAGTGTFGVGTQVEVTGASCVDETPPDNAFGPVRTVRPQVSDWCWGIRAHDWMLYPTTLPPQTFERRTPGVFHDPDGAPDTAPGAFTVPAHSKKTIVWDLGLYYCAYPELYTDGGRGATIRWGWAEAFRGPDGRKVQRNEWKGHDFVGFTDVFRPDGRAGARFTTPWWRCGRWCRLEIETGDEPLAVTRIDIAESRYPLESEAAFRCDDPTLDTVQALCLRGMQMCAHEMFFDCPYYEQQMYPGDTRVQLLVVGTLARDDRSIRNAMTLYDLGRRDNGMTGMNLPTRGLQESATYTMCWVLMYGDYAQMHANVPWLRARVPGMRDALFGLEAYENADGLLENLPGWSFMDWVGSWKNGSAPRGESGQGVSALNNLLFLAALQSAERTETALGEKELAARWHAKAEALAAAIVARFWDETRGMVADTDDKTLFSEHAQCLALLTDLLPPDRAERAWQGLLTATDLARASVYFSHYLFDTYFRRGRADLFLRRLDLWRHYVERGLTTPLEQPDDEPNQPESRSDCHAWGAHPIYHLHHGVAGISAAEPFFRSVRIAPCPGPLRWFRSRTPVPVGFVECDLAFENGSVHGTVTLPEGLPGSFVWGSSTIPLHAGANEIRV